MMGPHATPKNVEATTTQQQQQQQPDYFVTNETKNPIDTFYLQCTNNPSSNIKKGLSAYTMIIKIKLYKIMLKNKIHLDVYAK